MQIFIIVDSNKHIILNVEPTDRILYLKAKINEQLGIPINQQQIIYQSKNLNNESTLNYYSIKEDSALHLETNSLTIPISIVNIDGKIFTIEVNPYARIEDVKKLIYERTGINHCGLKIIFGGKQLEDEYTLKDYAIEKDSKLHLVLRLRGDKPVIYLYPEQDNFDVSVNINMKKEDGEITSLYPIIKGKDTNTWIVKANKNGEITYNNRKHYYLFWECLFNKTFVIDEGFCIKGNNCYEFFEEKLQYLGFKEKEANDFITYWCPKMEHSNYVLIKFQDEDYDKRAPLTIEPKPDYMKRIFMTFKLVQEKVEIPVQNLEKYKIKERKGFFVFEWGGSQVE